jgi:hypothetical protein
MTALAVCVAVQLGAVVQTVLTVVAVSGWGHGAWGALIDMCIDMLYECGLTWCGVKHLPSTGLAWLGCSMTTRCKSRTEHEKAAVL